MREGYVGFSWWSMNENNCLCTGGSIGCEGEELYRWFGEMETPPHGPTTDIPDHTDFVMSCPFDYDPVVIEPAIHYGMFCNHISRA